MAQSRIIVFLFSIAILAVVSVVWPGPLKAALARVRDRFRLV